MVPRYLSPEIPCPPNLGADKSRLLESNDNTIIIELTYIDGGTEIFHIDKDTYLLSKHEEKDILKNGTSIYQLTEYNVIDYK